jgi:hypothetical protein
MTIDVTQEDRDAAFKCQAANVVRFMRGGTSQTDIIDLLAEHFAAYRARIEAAATAKERERNKDKYRRLCDAAFAAESMVSEADERRMACKPQFDELRAALKELTT